MSKFANSRDGIAAPLLLWQEIPTQISTMDTYELQVYPTTNIFAGGPIIFNLPPQSRGMLWDVEIKTKLKISCDSKAEKGDILKGLGIINNFANSLWELAEVRVDDRIDLMQSMRNSYAYTTFFNHCFNTESAHADHLYHNQLFKMDEGGTRTEAENSEVYHFKTDVDKLARELNLKVIDADSNLSDYDYPEELRKIKELKIDNSKFLTGKHTNNPAVADRAIRMNRYDESFNITTKLHCPLMNTSKALPTNMKLRIALTKNSDEFLLYVTRQVEDKELYDSCGVVIEDVYLNVTYYEPRDVILQHIEDQIQQEPAPYFITRPEIIIKPITNANRTIRITNLFHDKLPNQAFMCLQRSGDFHGDRHTSPFIFEPYASCQLFVDGRPHFPKPLEASFETRGLARYWTKNQDFFQELYKTIGRDLAGDCLINSSNFHLNFMTAINFTADRSTPTSRHLNLQRRATTSLEIDMGYENNIPKDMVLLIYAIYDRQVQISGDRSIVVID